MTESGLEMRSNPPQNSSISLPSAPQIISGNNNLLFEIIFIINYWRGI